jgi:hypothetical protein
LNLRPLGYEPNELPGCSTPRQEKISITKIRRDHALGFEPGFGCGAGFGIGLGFG